MINRKICLRLFSISCSNNHHHHHQLFNRHCRRRFCSSMAGGAAPTFSISCKDPAAVRYLSVPKSSFSAAAVEYRRSISLRIKGCCSSENSGSNGGGGGGGSAFELHKVRATSSSPQQVLRELVSEEINNFCLKNRIGSGDGTGAAQIDRGSCLQFPGDRSLSEKIVVAVDVDEVLGNFVSALNRFIADRYSLNHSVSEYHVYEFFKIWNCSRDEADIRVHEFFKTAYFKQGIYPIPGALKALQKLSKFCSFSIVTSRQNAIKDHTIEWIEKHYQGLFQEMHFGNHFALDGKSIPKSEICRSMGAKVLIDDNPRYAIECAKVGIQVLLFDYENSYPWCKTESVKHHPLVTKVHNWEEVEHQLFSWTDS